MRFKFLSKTTDSALENLPRALRGHGFSIIKVLEAEIRNQKTKEVLEDSYSWHLEGSLKNFLKFKRMYGLSTMKDGNGGIALYFYDEDEAD